MSQESQTLNGQIVLESIAQRRPMNPDLIKLRAQIKECETFIAVCERIKYLEKQQEEGRLVAKKHRLENERIEILSQLQQVSNELLALEASLNSNARPMGAYEEDQLKTLIKSARIRISSLRLAESGTNEQIESIDKEITSEADELQQLYSKLEEGISIGGFDPNTITAKLQELRREKDNLSDAVRADFPTRVKAEEHKLVLRPGKGSPVHATEFFAGLKADLEQAKTSVEIITANMQNVARALEIITKLGELTARGINVTVYTRPTTEMFPHVRADSQRAIAEAHRLLITVVQRSGIDYNAVIIDNQISWEGSVEILGAKQPKETMRRTAGSHHVRELRHFLFNQ